MNQRRSGHNWEREVVNDFSSLFNLTKDEIGTTRENSRKMDANAIDIWFASNPFGIDFQCKEKTTNSETLVPLEASYFEQMKTKHNKVILFKNYRKKKDSKRRTVVGKYAILEYDHFLKILEMLWNQHIQTQ